MRIECPYCLKISSIAEDLVLYRHEALDVRCPACDALVSINLLANCATDRHTGDPSGNFVESNGLEQTTEAAEKQLQVTALKSKILRGLANLPPMPHIILKAKDVMADPNSSLRDLAGIIENDQAIVARVLTLSNSAYYGLSGMVSNIQHASVLLGQKILGELITIAASSALLRQKLKGYDVLPETLWKHSLAVAFGSKIIAERINSTLGDDAFITGLLHDAGKILVDPYIFKNKNRYTDLLQNNRMACIDAERNILGFDHAEIMWRASRLWRFPENQATAFRYHHDPLQSDDSELAYIIYLADDIAGASGYGLNGTQGGSDQRKDVLVALGLRESELVDIGEETHSCVLKIEEEYEMD
jgi:HD-like signal output (HDOD) protein